MVPAITTTTASTDLLNDQPSTSNMAAAIKGVVILARNGDRSECYQDPKTYQYGTTESTPLGEVRSPTRHLCFTAPL